MKKNLKQTTRFSRGKIFKQYTKSNPIILVDVGARGGIDSMWRNLSHGSIRFLGFEPDIKECKRLNEKSGKNHTYFPIALDNRRGTIKMNIMQNPVNSSVYLPNFLLWNRFSNSDEMEVIDNNVYENVKELLAKNKLSPEHQLLKNMRSTIGNYLKERMPSFYNLIRKKEL